METSKNELLEKGWVSIGFDGVLEYFAKESEDDEILYIPVYQDKTIGNVRSSTKNMIKLLSGFVN